MSMMQTAEGAFDEMTNIAYRMKELATQGSSDTNGAKEWAAQSAEYTALATELTNIMDNTSFGDGTKLLAATGKFDISRVGNARNRVSSLIVGVFHSADTLSEK